MKELGLQLMKSFNNSYSAVLQGTGKNMLFSECLASGYLISLSRLEIVTKHLSGTHNTDRFPPQLRHKRESRQLGNRQIWVVPHCIFHFCLRDSCARTPRVLSEKSIIIFFMVKDWVCIHWAHFCLFSSYYGHTIALFFSLKGGEIRHGRGCGSSPSASEDMEVLSTHPHSQSPTRLL